jgi:dienelactone hydrolase
VKTRVDHCEIPSGDASLEGTLLTPATVIPGVLFVHGWGGSQAQDLARATAAAGLGCACLTFDLRGDARDKGRSETVTRAQNLADLIAAYDYLASERGVDPRAMVVVGTSYGAYLATLLSTKRRVRWLALHAPALYKDEHWDKPKKSLNADPGLLAYRRSPLTPADNRALAACADFRGDVLMVQSEHDEIIPPQVVANYVAAFKSATSVSSHVIQGADHALTSEESQTAYSVLLAAWITRMVIGARVPKMAVPA